jgi:ATP-binding cassette subfamily B protein
LVGYSGSGKTTFINLILGLINIQKGKIFFNNQEVTAINPNAIFPFVSVISQNSTLFNRTIFENIAYSDLSATKHDIITAAKKACIHDFILSLPKQYDTIVGENGIRLSGGQKQRLIIARAILKKAQIIIFDEATTSLDAITEKQIVNEWFELFKNKTCILVSHRLSTLTRSDNLLVFNNGQIIQQGTHQSLLKKDGLYKNLWHAYTNSHIDNIGELS